MKSILKHMRFKPKELVERHQLQVGDVITYDLTDEDHYLVVIDHQYRNSRVQYSADRRDNPELKGSWQPVHKDNRRVHWLGHRTPTEEEIEVASRYKKYIEEAILKEKSK